MQVIAKISRLDRCALIRLDRLVLLAPPTHVKTVKKNPLPIDVVLGRIVSTVFLEFWVVLDIRLGHLEERVFLQLRFEMLLKVEKG